jgi:diguanylate cyclase (GGDEF)-like protein
VAGHQWRRGGRDGRRRQAAHRPPAEPGALADGSVTCLAQGADGTIWVATLDGTLHRMQAGSGQFERFDTAQGLPGGPIRTMVFGPDGALWAGSLNGLARIARGSNQASAWSHRPDDEASLSGREVEALAFGPDGTLWVGTERGLNAIDTASGKAKRILRDPARADSLPDNWVPDLMVARDGRLWLATQAGVAILDKWDGKTARFDLLGPRLKLPPQPAQSLIEDAQGQVWVGSRVRIDPATWRTRSFDRADGNVFPTLYIASRHRTRAGELLFGSPEGLLSVQPAKLAEWTWTPPLVATALSVDGQDQPGASAMASRVLRPGQHNLRLEFAALDYSAPRQLRYRYRLDGYDRDWIEVDAAQRVAAYAYLPPGDFNLRIQGSNRAGAWSPAEWRMALQVVPAYYQSWWFRVLMGLAGVAAIAGLFRLRLHQLRRRAALLERTVAERTASLEAAYLRIEQASLTDPLTQLHNRRFLEQVIQADLDLVVRRHREGASMPSASDMVLLMLDLDHFKQVNDQYGHAAGDAVLTQTAAILKRCMRNTDYVVRWGGEEFLLVARFMEPGQGAALAEKIRAAIEAHSFELPTGQALRKTVSIGFAPYPFVPGLATAVTLDTLQRIADNALYAAKRSWRNAWVGIAVQPGSDADGFLADAEAAVARGEVRVLAAPGKAGQVRWS